MAMALMASRIPPVPAAAMPINSGPLRNDSATFSIGPSHQPRIKVIPSNRTTPKPLLRFAAIAYCKPITRPNKTIVLKIGC